MKADTTTFEVHSVFFLTGKQVTVIGGTIKDGTVKVGMKAKALVDGGLFMTASIKSVELIRSETIKCNVGLILDTPEESARASWKALCLPGDLISIEE